MLAYAKYPVSAVKIQCENRTNEIIDEFYFENDIEEKDKLQKELQSLESLLKMCSTLKTYGETTKKYITLDLEYVNLLWPNKL